MIRTMMVIIKIVIAFLFSIWTFTSAHDYFTRNNENKMVYRCYVIYTRADQSFSEIDYNNVFNNSEKSEPCKLYRLETKQNHDSVHEAALVDENRFSTKQTTVDLEKLDFVFFAGISDQSQLSRYRRSVVNTLIFIEWQEREYGVTHHMYLWIDNSLQDHPYLPWFFMRNYGILELSSLNLHDYVINRDLDAWFINPKVKITILDIFKQTLDPQRPGWADGLQTPEGVYLPDHVVQSESAMCACMYMFRLTSEWMQHFMKIWIANHETAVKSGSILKSTPAHDQLSLGYTLFMELCRLYPAACGRRFKYYWQGACPENRCHRVVAENWTELTNGEVWFEPALVISNPEINRVKYIGFVPHTSSDLRNFALVNCPPEIHHCSSMELPSLFHHWSSDYYFRNLHLVPDNWESILGTQ